jgi:hypothetical protein
MGRCPDSNRLIFEMKKEANSNLSFREMLLFGFSVNSRHAGGGNFYFTYFIALFSQGGANPFDCSV